MTPGRHALSATLDERRLAEETQAQGDTDSETLYERPGIAVAAAILRKAGVVGQSLDAHQ